MGETKATSAASLLVARLEMVGDEIADGGAGALQFGFVGQVDDQHVELSSSGDVYVPRRSKRCDVVLEGVLDVVEFHTCALDSSMSLSRLRLNSRKRALLNGLRKRLGDEGAGLLGDSCVCTRYEERMTSRGAMRLTGVRRRAGLEKLVLNVAAQDGQTP